MPFNSAIPQSGSGTEILYYKIAEDSEEHWQTPYYKTLCKILTVGLGYDAWRPGQLAAIHSAAEGKDVFVMFPTGAGKSATFQVPGLFQTGKRKGITIVFSPLVSLMKDQAIKLLRRGIRTILFYGDQPEELYDGCMRQLFASVHPTFMFLTPERFKTNQMWEILHRLNSQGQIARFVIDEAQCVIQWGNRFRGSYLGLRNIRTEFPTVPIMALTASISNYDVEATINILGIQGCHMVALHPNRPNLTYFVVECGKVNGAISRMRMIINLVKKEPRTSSGIIYCSSVNSCKGVIKELGDAGIQSRPYYGSMSNTKKDASYHAWMSDECPIIVATNAFGMGIDKPNVRWILFYDIPESVGQVYQESGRAGRDGLPAKCWIFYLFSDAHFLYDLIQSDTNDEGAIAQSRQNTHDVMQMCMDSTKCRRFFILGYFDKAYADMEMDCQACDVCLGLQRKKWDIVNAYDWAMNMVKILQEIKEKYPGEHIHLQILTDIAMPGKGSNHDLTKRIKDSGSCSLAGVCRGTLPHGKEARRGDVERIGVYLVLRHVLEEYPVKAGRGNKNNWYLKLGPKANDFFNGSEFFLPLPIVTSITKERKRLRENVVSGKPKGISKSKKAARKGPVLLDTH